jgi:hypothetical protein
MEKSKDLNLLRDIVEFRQEYLWEDPKKRVVKMPEKKEKLDSKQLLCSRDFLKRRLD